MRLGPDLIGQRRRFVTTAQNRVVQVGRVRFSGIKRYNNSLTLCIYPDVAHSRDAHERFSQFADAFIAILPFRRDRDSLQHRFLCALQGMRVRWIEMLRIEWFDHGSIYASGRAALVLVFKVLSAAKPPQQSRFVWREHFLSFRAQSRDL